ncbi:hypothetical protein PS467_15965 [Streptomyces luomodiensis]|uniref:Uncharacterized protein n=1 Tax=Streptomyces luomodiensis TaxID=3026192 RepID=A0ABY9UW19_9ACTN|nr:hypothetical protein [Streptomyces sp. SCA4-21]WNE96718.1 hypothetical protein PS467_15965 [Streptomyces sp. SCA4-21]
MLAPNEHLAGTADIGQLLARLAELRATTDTLTEQHPTVTFRPLPQALRRWEAAGLNTGLFRYGLAVLRPRYAALSLSRLLPLERVLVGVQSSRDGAFGGFHYSNQGYRHLQMRALITTYGPMAAGLPERPDMAALDLLRAYAHGCLHYGSYRSYRLRGNEVVRTQYGVNFRRHDGRTYSAPDLAGSPTTRNLGVVMEGACDREARSIARAAAQQFGVAELVGIDRYGYRDVTGLLDIADTDELARQEVCDAVAPTPAAADLLGAMGRYQASVNQRYGMFLDEVGRSEADDLHATVLTSMISGVLTPLCAWLRDRHGAKAFEALFLSPAYFGPVRSA